MKNNQYIKNLLPFAFAACCLLPGVSHAWWDDSWTVRKKITLNVNQVDIKQEVADVPVLVRLHTGAFDFSNAKDDGSDIRFVAEDDKTLLKYHIEKYDPVNEMAFIWVKVPKLTATKPVTILMYSGNDKATAAADAKATYDAEQLAVYHFGEKDGMPKDITGSGMDATQFTGKLVDGSLIGGGAGFDGKGSMIVPAIKPGQGLTISMWIKPASAGETASLFQAGGLTLGLDGGKLYGAEGTTKTVTAAEVPAGAWHHVALTLGSTMTVYIDGKASGAVAASPADFAGIATVGKGFAGEMDEVELAGVARTPDWVQLAAKSQGPDSLLVGLGEDETKDSGGGTSYFGTILHSVTLDGWVVIGILMVMAVISWMVMLVKTLVIGKAEKMNTLFLTDYSRLALADTAKMDANDETDDLNDEPLLSVLAGKHDHYQGSPLYRIYHVGEQEIKHRFGFANSGSQNLSPQALGSIKAKLDATVVRENQKLNSLMVLLTIAISGGPFLGLLGTVVGVMITFAAIAATGDVNVAAIAPGIAAALVATVAGLAVAIPALFGYNYIGSKIKNITADMQVFSDEFISRITETYTS